MVEFSLHKHIFLGFSMDRKKYKIVLIKLI